MQKLLTKEEQELIDEALHFYSFDQNPDWEEENLPLIESIRLKLGIGEKKES